MTAIDYKLVLNLSAVCSKPMNFPWFCPQSTSVLYTAAGFFQFTSDHERISSVQSISKDAGKNSRLT